MGSQFVSLSHGQCLSLYFDQFDRVSSSDSKLSVYFKLSGLSLSHCLIVVVCRCLFDQFDRVSPSDSKLSVFLLCLVCRSQCRFLTKY